MVLPLPLILGSRYGLLQDSFDILHTLCTTTVFGIVKTDAYLLYKMFHLRSSKLSHSDFIAAVPKALLMPKSVRIQANCTRFESENKHMPYIFCHLGNPVSSILQDKGFTTYTMQC